MGGRLASPLSSDCPRAESREQRAKSKEQIAESRIAIGVEAQRGVPTCYSHTRVEGPHKRAMSAAFSSAANRFGGLTNLI